MDNMLLQQRDLKQPLQQYEYLGSTTLARILSARDVATDQLDLQLRSLLQPDLKGLTQAITLIDQAIDAQQQILIVGDYDVDGATSTALMILALQQMGALVHYIVPDRFKYGYGLTPAIADLAHERYQPDLLITVDNGISSHAGVDRCHALDMQVIVTDHHLTTKATPDAEAVVNPNQLGCNFASKSLAGVGVAFYVLASLASHRQKQGKTSCKLSHYLDLVALGTVADVAKLDFNNRILVQAGLKKIREGQCRAGILALLDLAGKNPLQLQAQDFGFVLGPRINAAGRMDSMQIGIECLLAENLQQAFPLAYQLDQLNLERRQVERGMREQAFDYLEQVQLDGEQLPQAIVLFEPEWHQGVIGIVAGRLKEHFHRPSIVFALDEDGQHLKGSARSIEGIHIRDSIEAVAQQQSDLVKFFGGHAAAAGLTIEKEKFTQFQQCFIAQIQHYHPDIFHSKLLTDGALAENEFNLDFLEKIQNLGPWGQGFEAPVFDGIFDVMDYQWLKDIHLKLTLKLPSHQIVSAIGFNYLEKLNDTRISSKIRLAFTLEKNEFRQQSQLQLRILFLQNL
ncbi:single-stranded-DNA-specific exonuclease RecJ [Acinetobacter qingfengensis]|uniref:Single-stranded-DNA-specific exonuclease RecJ n=1 Tax=Acinetobacter qingfengensis TaxID=1262585 RepID=A0A1E7QWH6_9GAMM|nr:single-stranded-DNA-specific exonuclease RecJ [Acinetobacter qingfengensis]KAA8731296.1 single-stranded-DNA-specific exonuclease RecJ [Acinetobacter qingfengensis]OEY91455.1 single-stranded-DNA-specific exonuclease RecJ [Acinetobacter qingfengensis]